MIEFHNVSKRYPNGFEALKDINLKIGQGEFVAVIGLSGAGKSTLIRTINRMHDITGGTLTVDGINVMELQGKSLRAFRRKIGMIFQSFNLITRTTVIKNVLTAFVPELPWWRAFLGIFKKEEKIAALENQKSAESLEYTISGRVGRFLEPVFRPIGFDWKLTTASIGALAAKEVFVSQLGILYAEGETDEESESLRERLASNYTPLQGFCIMLFSLLSIPCFATLAIIRRELNSRKAALLEALVLFALAYVVTLIVYQTGVFFDLGNKLIQ